jgi:hypothetical protein
MVRFLDFDTPPATQSAESPRKATDMPNDIHIHPAETARDRRAIVTLPWRIYRNDPLWVPPLISERLARR